MSIDIEIGKRIRQRREELGMSQEELAHRLGYKNKTSIAKIGRAVIQSDNTCKYVLEYEYLLILKRK